MLLRALTALCLASAIALTGVTIASVADAKPRPTLAKKQTRAAVYRACGDGKKLATKFTRKTLRKAYRTMPSDLRQYTGCRSSIKKAIRTRARRGLA